MTQIISDGFPLPDRFEDADRYARMLGERLSQIAAITHGIEMGEVRPANDVVVNSASWIPVPLLDVQNNLRPRAQLAPPIASNLRLTADLDLSISAEAHFQVELLVNGSPIRRVDYHPQASYLLEEAEGGLDVLTFTAPLVEVGIEQSAVAVLGLQARMPDYDTDPAKFKVLETSLIHYFLVPKRQ